MKIFIKVMILVFCLIGLFMYLVMVGAKMSLSEEEIERDKEAEIKWLNELEEKRKNKIRNKKRR